MSMVGDYRLNSGSNQFDSYWLSDYTDKVALSLSII